MKLPHVLLLSLLALPVTAGGSFVPQFAGQPAQAQTPSGSSTPEQAQPTVGQEGKDVIWLPTGEAVVQRMLDLANVTAADYVVDLGSGDGRTVIAAAKRGAKALGIEYDPALVEVSKRNAEKEGVSDRASFKKADLFETDFSDASVLTMFLLSEINLRLRPKILNLKPGTRVVSNTFDMGDWKPDETVQVAECRSFCKAHFWVVPAKVDGKWILGDGELTLEQKYQHFTGSLKVGETVSPISDSKLNGAEISFKAGDRTFRGKVNGNAIEGVNEGAAQGAWRATRG